jgi:ribosome-associated translation inhibitor RaiA
MRTQIIFRGFAGLDHLKAFVLDSLEQSVGKLDTHKVDDVKVILDTTHHRHEGQPPEFLCEAIIKTRQRTFFTKKIDRDFHMSVKKCMKVIAKNLLNSNRAKRDKRRVLDRHQLAYDFNLTSS